MDELEFIRSLGCNGRNGHSRLEKLEMYRKASEEKVNIPIDLGARSGLRMGWHRGGTA